MTKGKILLVEDERDLARPLQYNFEKEGYRIDYAQDAESALPLFHKARPDLIVLDIMLPKMDGLELCRIIRQTSDVPILFLTARKSEIDRILGLKLGADDYVTKPFSIGELLARIQSILRRTGPRTPRSETGPIRIGELEIDLDQHEVRIKGRPADLTPKEFHFLRFLIEAKGKVLSRDNLLEHVWGYDQSMNIDTRTVDQHIARLRRKLKSEGSRIVTVTNIGYRIRLD